MTRLSLAVCAKDMYISTCFGFLRKRRHTLKTLSKGILVLSIILIFSGCNQRRSGDAPEDRESGGRGVAPAESFEVGDDGMARLLPPNDLQQRKGVEVTNTEHLAIGAKSMGSENSWQYASKPKHNGSFLVAATSRQGTTGGDMIRRIDLGSPITEFDYDSDLKGAQGAYIYVPDEMRAAVPSKYIDSDSLFSGIICGFIPGPNKTVIALAGGTEGGVAFVINPYEEATAFTPLQAIQFPYASNPCRAVYSPELKKLYVVDVARTESHGSQEGVFVADIYNDKRGVIASLYTFDAKSVVNSHTVSNFQGLEIYGDDLYLLSGNGRFDAEWDSVIYRVPLNKAGEPLFNEVSYTRTFNPIFRAEGCPLSSWNLASIAIIDNGDKPVLLSTGTTSTVAWDISGQELKKIDMNPKRPGVQSLSTEDNGQGGLKMLFDPDGKTIYQLPHCRSNTNKIKIGNSAEMLAFNITPISVPDLQMRDPIDVGYRDLLISLKDSPYRPMFSMVFRDFAVGTKHIGVLGSSASNLSGLQSGADITIIDKSKKSPISFNKAADSRRAHEVKYGFKLAQGDPKFDHSEQNSHAIIWIP